MHTGSHTDCLSSFSEEFLHFVTPSMSTPFRASALCCFSPFLVPHPLHLNPQESLAKSLAKEKDELAWETALKLISRLIC